MRTLFIIIFFFINISVSQNIDVNNEFNYNFLRSSIINGDIETDYSLNIRPLSLNNFGEFLTNQNKSIFKNDKANIELKTMGIDYFIEFNSHHPYNRNNGSMIPNKGYQHIISPGIFFRLGPLSVQLN